MKKSILSICLILLLFPVSRKAEAQQVNDMKGEIQLSGAFALYPMVVRWAEEFRKIYPGVRIDISAGGAGKGMTDALANIVDMGMVSRDIYEQELAKGAYPIAVVKDAVIPTINVENPLFQDIVRIGLKRDVARRLWSEEIAYWGMLFLPAIRCRCMYILVPMRVERVKPGLHGWV